MSLGQHFFTMTCHNAWANHRLLTACGALSDEAFTADRGGFFRSMAGTANHTLTVDWFYVEPLERWLDGLPPHDDPARFFDPEQPFATCATLLEAQHAVDQRLIAACRRLTDAHLAGGVPLKRRQGLVVEAVPRYLAHLFQHQIHHRGQLHGMLSHAGATPPQLDEFFCAGEASKRADELAALGLSEAEIWPTALR